MLAGYNVIHEQAASRQLLLQLPGPVCRAVFATFVARRLPERYLLLALDPSVERASYNQQ
jgi:hypothetical protein